MAWNLPTVSVYGYMALPFLKAAMSAITVIIDGAYVRVISSSVHKKTICGT